MDQYVLRVFHLEVERQCTFGLLAARDLQKAVDRRDDDRAWYSIQSLLVAAGNLSKLLWPDPKRNKNRPLIPERGEELRATLPVSNPSPLEPPRDLRNHLEHFDERLEEWASAYASPIFVDSLISPRRVMEPGNPGEPVYLRHYDSQNHVVYYRSESQELNPIIEEMERLWNVAKESKHGLPKPAPSPPSS